MFNKSTVFFILLIHYLSASILTLPLNTVCERFWQCGKEMMEYEEKCDNMHEKEGSERPWYIQKTKKVFEDGRSVCGRELKEDYDRMGLEVLEQKKQIYQCIKKAVNATQKINKEKSAFCSTYLSSALMEEPKTTSDCWMNVKRISTRCTALKQCCTPAPRCEQDALHGHTGRTISAMRDEVSIKMAACKQRMGSQEVDMPVIGTAKKHKKSRPSNGRKLKKQMKEVKKDKAKLLLSGDTSTSNETEIVDGKNPPYALCLRYLQCQKDFTEMRARCSVLNKLHKSGKDYSWTTAYHYLPSPLDDRDSFCRSRFSDLYESLNKKRKAAEDYLDHCVPIANVDEAENLKQRPCDPSSLTPLPSVSSLQEGTCLSSVLQFRNQCLLLRDCCVQADVCERNAMYGVLADEFLVANSELRTMMNSCYHG